MYSDMSIRTIACSESNMNSASARASSVFPTPVEPRRRKTPIGRFGSARPARERRGDGVVDVGRGGGGGGEGGRGGGRVGGVLLGGLVGEHRATAGVELGES